MLSTVFMRTEEGILQRQPLSMLLTNVYLDDRDKKLGTCPSNSRPDARIFLSQCRIQGRWR